MYYNTEKGKQMHLRLIRLRIISILGFIIGGYIILETIMTHIGYEYFVAIPLLLASFVFLIGSIKVNLKVLNQFALKIPRFKNK